MLKYSGDFLSIIDEDILQRFIYGIIDAVSEMEKCTSFDEDTFIKNRTL